MVLGDFDVGKSITRAIGRGGPSKWISPHQNHYVPRSINNRDASFKLLRSSGIDSVSLTGRYDNSIPTRFLAPIDCSKIPEQVR
jgi:hypothetical protein